MSLVASNPQRIITQLCGSTQLIFFSLAKIGSKQEAAPACKYVCFSCKLENSTSYFLSRRACVCVAGGSQCESVAWGELQIVRCWFLSALLRGLKAIRAPIAHPVRMNQRDKKVCSRFILPETLPGVSLTWQTVDVDTFSRVY